MFTPQNIDSSQTPLRKMGKSSFLVDLRPDRDLLDPLFGGYKLSLDSVPVYKKPLPQGVDSIQPNDDQFSFAHVKLFSLQNHLHVNPFTNSTYFVDKNWSVTKIILSPLNKLEDMQLVWKIPPVQGEKKRLYNVSMMFAAPDTVILSDGAGTAHIISINNKENLEHWESASSHVLCENELGFLLSSVQIEKKDGQSFLHVVLVYVEEKRAKAKEIISTGLFHTLIEWITLKKIKEEEWTKNSSKKLEVDGNVDYIALEPGCRALYIVSDKVPKWTFDSEKPVVEERNESEKETVQEKVYSWSQVEDEITLWMPAAEDITKSDVSIKVEPTHLEVKMKDEVIISGEFFNRIDKDMTSWSLEKNKLEIQLMKQESGQMWQELIQNDKRGEQVFDPELVGRVHEQLAHLCSDKEVDPGQPSFNSQQLEECDALSCDTVVLVRVSGETHFVTHEISLSSFQWLFKVWCYPKKPPAICLRHDVDACIWQFAKTEDDDKNWPYKHIGTFSAFGYVQASKNQKKYLCCPPDLSYVTICETSRHIYLYRQPSAVTGELRNRASGKKVETVSKQQLINLDTNEQILGVHATNSVLYVLNENTIHVLTINE